MRHLVFLSLLGLTWSAAAAAPRAKPKATPAPASAVEPPPTAAPAPAEPVAPAPAPALPPAAPVHAAPSPAPAAPTTGRPKLIVLGLTAAGGVDPALAESLTETLAVEITRTHLFEVTSQKDIATLLGLERQKQLLGCSEESTSCISELADALGARFIVSGSLARLGEVYQLNLQTQDTVKTQTLGRATRIASDLNALRAQLPYAIAEATATPPPQPPSKVLPVVLIGTGSAAVVAAGVVFLQSFAREQAAISELTLAKTQPQLQLKPASYYSQEAAAVSQLRLVGGIVAGVGAALIITGIVVYPREASGTQVTLVPTSNGAALVGVWP